MFAEPGTAGRPCGSAITTPRQAQALRLLLAAHGDVKYHDRMKSLANRTFPDEIEWSKMRMHKARLHLRACLQIAALVAPGGESRTASNVLAGRMSRIRKRSPEQA